MKQFGGEGFLHQRDSELHTSPPVEHEQERRKAAGKETSQKPAEKLKAWMNVLERTHMGHRDDPRVLERIKEYYHYQYVIKPEDVPESYFENQLRMARELGHGDIEITNELREQSIEIIISDQNSTLDSWVDYLTSTDSDNFPTWAKYWAFTGMLKLSAYDKEKHAFGKRDKTTVAPFADLNREALAYVVDAIVRQVEGQGQTATEGNPELAKLLQGANFGKLYAWAIEKVTPAEEHELLDTRGEWVRYPQNSDRMPLVESLQGHGTGWCTAGETTAQTQLQGGDFYVYYSLDKDGKPTVPRAAIRMNGNSIGEVRGIVGRDQNLDPYMGDIVEDKLKEFPDGEKYQKKVSNMKQLTDIEKRHRVGSELTSADLRFLYEVDSPIEGFGYQKDPRINELRDQRDVETDVPVVFDCAPEQIAHNVSEINEHTQAYVGELQPGIFDRLPLSVEHIYTDFPERKVKIFKDLELGTGPKTGEKFIRPLKAQGYQVGDFVKQLLRSPEFRVSQEPQKIDLVILRVDSLGRQFAHGGEWQAIDDRALELGLDRCPAEAGPQLRSQYPKQPQNEYVSIGMAPIAGAGDHPGVFDVSRDGFDRWLSTNWVFPNSRWHGGSRVAFVRRKSLRFSPAI